MKMNEDNKVRASDEFESIKTENELQHNGAPDRYLLCSGGMDSTAMTHYMHEQVWDNWTAWNKRPVVIYLETTIGLSSQRLYVQLLGRHYGWQVWCLQTQEDFASHSKEQGFYGPMKHDTIFNFLKGRQLGKLSTTSGNPHLYFGSRVEEKGDKVKRKAWREDHGAYTHNPIYDWTDEEVVTYLRHHQVPFNPNWKGAHPTDCACGATAAREELVELEAEGYVVFANKLRNLEDRVDTGDRREEWAWGSFSPEKQAIKDAKNDPQQLQLSDLVCGKNCSGRSKLADLKKEEPNMND